MGNLILRLAYDGTGYHGFQRQPEHCGPTIQGELEGAWEKLFAEKIKLVTAGRTDAGVHAAGQVVNFNTKARIPVEKVPKALNSVLPTDIRILEAKQGEFDFNARKSACWKRYDYRIDNGKIPDVFHRLYALHEPVLLDVEAMQEAAFQIEGTHDFRAFAAAGTSAKSFVRTLYHCKVASQGTQIQATCVGDGFLYNMVRIIAGTLIAVGKRKLPPEEIGGVLKTGERKNAGMTVAPHGLTLTAVQYEPVLPSSIFNDLAANETEEGIYRSWENRNKGTIYGINH